MSKVLFILLFIIFTLGFHKSFADECNYSPSLKIGIIENGYIDYKYYLYYTLSKYSHKNKIETEISYVNYNHDEFDIIFGEYNDLVKLSHYKIDVPNKIENFYKDNEIKIENNIFPLDLDTFVLISKEKNKVTNLEELSIYNDPYKYSLGMNLYPTINLKKFISFILGKESYNLSEVTFESKINLLEKTISNINKNFVENNYLELYKSFENNENVFTIFNDGTLLYENIQYYSYQIFPNSIYKWNEKIGYFEKNNSSKPFSFYGFSAYVNNSNNFGYMCFLLEEETRNDAFTKFNLGISPLSIKDVKFLTGTNNLPQGYLDILKLKNKNIIEFDDFTNLNSYEDLLHFYFNEIEYEDFFGTENYLN